MPKNKDRGTCVHPHQQETTHKVKDTLFLRIIGIQELARKYCISFRKMYFQVDWVSTAAIDWLVWFGLTPPGITTIKKKYNNTPQILWHPFLVAYGWYLPSEVIVKECVF